MLSGVGLIDGVHHCEGRVFSVFFDTVFDVELLNFSF